MLLKATGKILCATINESQGRNLRREDMTKTSLEHVAVGDRG